MKQHSDDQKTYNTNAFEALEKGQVKAFVAALNDGANFFALEPNYSSRTLVDQVMLESPPSFKNTSRSFDFSRMPFVNALLDAGWDPKRPLPGGRYPLQQAFHMSTPSVALCLLRAGVDVNQSFDQGQSPLSYLLCSYSMKGDKESLIKILITKGANFKDLEETQETLAHLLRDGDMQAFNTLLFNWIDFDPNLPLKNSSRNKFYAPTVYWGAARYGFIRSQKDVEAWGALGADATVVDRHRTSILHAFLENLGEKANFTQSAGVWFSSNTIKPLMLAEVGKIMMSLGAQGARWTLKKKGGVCAYERVQSLLEKITPPNHPTLDCNLAFGGETAFMIDSQESHERLLGLPQAEEKLDNEEALLVKPRRRRL